MSRWKARITFATGWVLVALLLAVSACLLAAGPPARPRWTVEGNLHFLGSSRDGKTVFYGRTVHRGADHEESGTVCVAEVTSGTELFCVPYEKWCLHQRSPDDRFLAVWASDGSLHLLDIPARREYRAALPPGRVAGFTFTPSGTLLVGGLGEHLSGPAFVVGAGSGRLLLELDGTCRYIGATSDGGLAFNRYRAESQAALEIWDVTGTPRVRRFAGLLGERMSPDGRFLLVTQMPKFDKERTPAPAAILDAAAGSPSVHCGGKGPKGRNH